MTTKIHKKPAAKTKAPALRETKIGKLTAMLKSKKGATLEQIAKASGWEPHTARAALTGLKKKGHTVTSSKAEDEERIYRVTAD